MNKELGQWFAGSFLSMGLISGCSGPVSLTATSRTTGTPSEGGVGGGANGAPVSTFGHGGVSGTGGAPMHPPEPSTDAGHSPTVVSDAGAPRVPDSGTNPDPDGKCVVTHDEQIVVPGAGAGMFSGCPPKVCDGYPIGADLSETFNQPNPASRFSGCTTIQGSLVVSMEAAADLSTLACLELVTGNALVWNNPGTVTLHGLESLAVVEGTFSVGYDSSLSADNGALQTIDALSNLRVVGKDLTLDVSPPPKSLAGLEAVVSIGGDLNVRVHDPVPNAQTPDLDLSGLNSLQSLGGSLNFLDVHRVTRVSGLRALRNVAGSITITGAADLAQFAVPPNLACLGGNFVVGSDYLQENTRLRSIGPFPSLHHIGGWVRIDGNPNVDTIRLFDTVESVDGGTVRISGNGQLSSLPVSALTSTSDDIIVSGSPLLSACPLNALGARLAAAGWKYHLVQDGLLACAAQ